MSPKSYSDNFHLFHMRGSLNSAEQLIPIIKKYVQPHSVIDIGCGIGTWLKVWREHGAKILAGVDGAYVKRDELLIPESEFTAIDLKLGYKTSQKFDLLSCLEVAEHIPPEASSLFVKSLCALSDVILFSAAIPGQEGTLHLNEQYPPYWIELFKKNNFSPIDCIRSQIWDHTEISWWYKQNILFFIKNDSVQKYPALLSEMKSTGVLSLVHPQLLAYKEGKIRYYENLISSPRSLFFYLLKWPLKLILQYIKK